MEAGLGVFEGIVTSATIALMTGLALAPWLSAAAPPKTADKSTVHFVEVFLGTPTTNLTPDSVVFFMSLDIKTLPNRLQEPSRARRSELLALKKISDGKKKPPIRRLGLDAPRCEDPMEGTPRLLKALELAGFVEVKEEDVKAAQEETHCSECELETEFTLIRVSMDEKVGKTTRKKIHFFFYGGDPIFIFIRAHQSGQPVTTGTAFFGSGTHGNCH